MRVLYTFAILTLFACSTRKIDHCDAYAVTQIWKEHPVSVHDEMSPKYKAVLSNGDTIPCTANTNVGDTIYYTYIKVNSND